MTGDIEFIELTLKVLKLFKYLDCAEKVIAKRPLEIGVLVVILVAVHRHSTSTTVTSSTSRDRDRNSIDPIVAYKAEADAFPVHATNTTTPSSAAMDKFAASFTSFGKTVSSSVTPFAARSQQWIREQTGNAGEKTELPHDYVELETRIDALKQTHQKLLAATSQYANEAYDYPPNIRESFQDLGKGISEKVGKAQSQAMTDSELMDAGLQVNLLSKSSSMADAQAAMTSPPSAKSQPKTFNHAIARAALHGSQSLSMATPQGSTEPDPLSQGLEKFAIAEEKVGEARLEQDEKIQGLFLAGWSTTLNQSIKSADKARTAVTNARLSLDAAKSRASAGGRHEENYTEQQRRAIEQAEDAFVERVDEATHVMRNVLDTPEPLRNVAELVKAQAGFHARAAEILEEVAKDIGEIQMDQETSYRQARDAQ